MSNHRNWTQTAIKAPAQQGFYWTAETDTGAGSSLAEYRQLTPAAGKQWWAYASADPTIEKTRELVADAIYYAKATTAEVSAALKREFTLAEKIDEAYKNYLGFNRISSWADSAPPASRQLNIGDALEVGNLDECVVIGLRDAGRVVVFQFKTLSSNDRTKIVPPISYSAMHWTQVLPSRGRSTSLTLKPVIDNYITTSLDSIIHESIRGLDVAPDYQRGYVWSDDDEQRLLDSVVQGRELGRFILVERAYPNRPYVLDGKQRLNCLTRFIKSELAWRGIYWHELDRLDRGAIEGRFIQVARLKEVNHSRADFLRIFLEVNAGGVPQTVEHLASVQQLLDAELAKDLAC